MILILKLCDFAQIFGYALQTTAFLINIKRWEALLLTTSLTEMNKKLESYKNRPSMVNLDPKA
jgi:hypothetical protein